MKIVIGADHRGYNHKEHLKEHITSDDITFIDVGAYSEDRSDYPEFSVAVAQKIQSKEAHIGILICGTGVGMSIVANRFTGIYAGIAWNIAVVRESKEDDNINVLILPADFVSQQTSLEIVSMWMTARFKGGHYQDRINKIDALGGIK